MGLTIESRSSDHMRAHHTRMPARRKEAADDSAGADGARRSQPAEEPRSRERIDDRRRTEDRTSEAAPREAPARSPGSGVQMDNDMLVWMQSS